MIRFDEIIDFDDFNKKLSEIYANIDQFNGDLKKQAAEVKKLFSSIDVTNVSADTVKQLENISQSTSKLKANKEELNRQQIEANRIKAEAEKIQAKLNAQESAEFRELQKNKIELSKRNAEIKKSIQLQDAADGSLKKMKYELSQLNAQYDLASKEIRSKLAPQIRKLNDLILKEEMAVGKAQRQVGWYSKAWNFASLKVLGAITAITGLIRGLNSATESVKQYNKDLKMTSEIFNDTTENITSLTSKIRILAKSLDSDYNEVLKAAKTLSEEFGISSKEATDLIEEGFRKGANVNGEYLELLKEYPTQLKSVGLSAKETIAIITETEQKGIFSDKGIDAIKEAGLRLREMPKATADALKSLDSMVQSQIKLKVESGNTFEAIKLISKELDSGKLTASQMQTIIADVFGGAGEDAGLRFLQSLQEINVNLDSITTKLNEFDAIDFEITKEVEKFNGQLLDTNSIVGKAVLLWDKFKLEVLRAINDVSMSTESMMQDIGKRNAITVDELTKSVDELVNIEKENRLKIMQDMSQGFDIHINELKNKITELSKVESEENEKTINQLNVKIGKYLESKSNLDSLISSEKIKIEQLEKERKEQERITAEKIKQQNIDNAVKQAEPLSRKTTLLDESKAVVNLKNDWSDLTNQQLKYNESIKEYTKLDYFKDQYIDRTSEWIEANRKDIEVFNQGLTDVNNLLQQQAAYNSRIIADYDSQISAVESKLQQEKEKSQQGLANTYESEMKNLADLQDAKEKAVDEQQRLANQQLIINKTLQASNLLLAISELYANAAKMGPLGIIGSSLSIVAMLAQFANFRTDIDKYEKGGYIGGKRHKDGGTLIEGELGEYMMSRDSVSRASQTIEAINEKGLSDSDIIPALKLYDFIGEKKDLQGATFISHSNKDVVSAINNMSNKLTNKQTFVSENYIVEEEKYGNCVIRNKYKI